MQVPAALAAALLACSSGAQAQEWTPTGRFDVQLAHEFSTGRYGEATRTRINQSTMTLRYRGERWMGEVALPWLRVGSDTSAGLPGAVRSGPAPLARGRGDAWLKFGVELLEGSVDGPGVDLVLRLKTRGGDATRGLGTGGVDRALQVEVLQPLGRWNAFGHLGWRRTGDVPGFAPYRDPWYGEVGAFTSLSPQVEVGGFFDARQPISALGPLREATAYAAFTSGAWRLQLHATRGFARASADAALGVTVRRRF